MAKRCLKPNSLTTQCGTPSYVAPEIVEGLPYDERVDMWSLGVLVYILLGGYQPFDEENQDDLFRVIRKGKYEFHDEYWGQVSSEAKDLIKSMLTVEPKRRASAKQALEKAWIHREEHHLTKMDLGLARKKFDKINERSSLSDFSKTFGNFQDLGFSSHIMSNKLDKSAILPPSGEDRSSFSELSSTSFKDTL